MLEHRVISLTRLANAASCDTIRNWRDGKIEVHLSTWLKIRRAASVAEESEQLLAWNSGDTALERVEFLV